jgi:hypothetical protein
MISRPRLENGFLHDTMQKRYCYANLLAQYTTVAYMTLWPGHSDLFWDPFSLACHVCRRLLLSVHASVEILVIQIKKRRPCRHEERPDLVLAAAGVSFGLHFRATDKQEKKTELWHDGLNWGPDSQPSTSDYVTAIRRRDTCPRYEAPPPGSLIMHSPSPDNILYNLIS